MEGPFSILRQHVQKQKSKATLKKIFCRCNVDRLLFLRRPLPLEGNFANIWSEVGKAIDPLHIKNHKVNKYKPLLVPHFQFQLKPYHDLIRLCKTGVT